MLGEDELAHHDSLNTYFKNQGEGILATISNQFFNNNLSNNSEEDFSQEIFYRLHYNQQ
jgi:hypothetical protein